jgi:GNAT superfamily N-acetyltransferase
VEVSVALNYTVLLESQFILPQFFERFREISVSRGGESDAFDVVAESKTKLILSEDIVGFVMWDSQEPVGLAWVERMTPTYGSILVYTSEARYQSDLVNYLVDSKLAVGVMAELLHFETDDSICQLFRDRGLMEIPRQRMVCHLPETLDYPEIPDGYTLLPLSSKTALQVSNLSVPAHKISGDYRGYPDMETVEGRLRLEHLVHSQFYGPLCHPASVGLMSGEEMHSVILNLLIPCWGQAKMPWIYDIATSTDVMGRGLGEWVLSYAKAVLVDFHFPMWGLAVSQCNVGAIRVYERNGFVVVDTFSEFLQHD